MLSERGDADALPLPGDGAAIIAARLDALSVEEKALLQDAAVVGRVFWSGALASDPEAVRAALHALERKEFVGRERAIQRSQGRSSTCSGMCCVHDVAYGQIPRGRSRGRSTCEPREWLESLGRREDHADMIAHHYLSTLEYVRAVGGEASRLAAPARRALVEAGARASALNAFEIAANYYEQALALSPDGDAKHPLLSVRIR